MLMQSVGFGLLLGYLSYHNSQYVKFLAKRPSFSKIRKFLFILPITISAYIGVKFMVSYKSKGKREIARDPQLLMSEEEYQKMVEDQSKVKMAV